MADQKHVYFNSLYFYRHFRIKNLFLELKLKRTGGNGAIGFLAPDLAGVG